MPTDAPDSPNPAATVSCRPPALNWVFVILCASIGVMAWFGAHNPSKAGPPSAADVIFVQTFAVSLLLTAAALAAWQTRIGIVADADGLRWRRFGGWEAASWEEVRDFYDQLPSQAQGRRSSMSAIIKTLTGDVRFSSEWANADAVRGQVERRATRAVVREWNILGSRPCDSWPQAFDYGAWSNRWMALILSVMLLVFLACTLARPILRTVSQFGADGWGVTLAMLGVFVVLILSKGALFLLIIGRYREAGRRRSEHITADTRGIVFDDGARRVEAAWAEVIGYGVTSGRNALMLRYAVETRRGDFDFLAEIRQALLLMAIIQHYAENSVDREWHLRDDIRTLGGEAARWSGGRVDVGARVYHYRTRADRALLWLPLAFCMAWGFLSWAGWQGLLPGTQAAGPFCAAVVCGLVFLGGWYAYRVCRIETDEDGLTQVTPWRRRRLVWGQVESYWLTGEYNNGVVQGRGERLRFSRGIVGYEELKEEIARRATECGGKAWERAR